MGEVTSHQYICGYCGNKVASSQGYHTQDTPGGLFAYVYVCPHCKKPSFIHAHVQIPGVVPGNDVDHLPEDIAALYREARNAVSIGANTAAVLACRKLLMNIAVSKKAKEGESFISYIDYLANEGYIPPNGRDWVDHIRSKGNEATHEIKLMGKDDAEDLISFAEMLLKFIYEFPNRVPRKTT
ncbi:MAG TPA: DUF4145 domain-containing protein [bacterium]|nr:DUF4145 domain-containing protein [bacterium]